MYRCIYKLTIKNLFRSASFWLLLLVLICTSVQGGLEGFYVGDNSPDMVLVFIDYVESVSNSCTAKLMMHVMPILAIITVTLILNRDYNDLFYEIEKAAGIKPFQYVLGRLSALVSINFLILFIMNLIVLHTYVFTRGGVDGMKMWQYITDSFVRILRVDTFVALPNLIFYISLTYFAGSLVKNGIGAAMISCAIVLANYYGMLMLWARVPEVIFYYLSPNSLKLRYYFHHYDTEQFNVTIQVLNTSLTDAVICISLLIGLAVVFCAVSYLRIRKRNT